MQLNKNDKVMIYSIIFIIIVVISLFVSLYFIWFSKDEDTGIDSYTYNGFEEEIITVYQKQLRILLKSTNVKLLAEKLDNSYIESNKLSLNNLNSLKSHFTTKGLLTKGYANITGYTVSMNDESGVAVYRFKYYNAQGYERYVNLIEKEPYVYSLSFEDDFVVSSAKKNIIDTYNDIKFEITLEESTKDSLKYNAKITNNSSELIKFDFNNVSSVELNLITGEKIKLSSVIASSEENYKLTKNSYLNQELFFVVPIEQQGKISSIVFYNVEIGEERHHIKIDF